MAALAGQGRLCASFASCVSGDWGRHNTPEKVNRKTNEIKGLSDHPYASARSPTVTFDNENKSTPMAAPTTVWRPLRASGTSSALWPSRPPAAALSFPWPSVRARPSSSTGARTGLFSTACVASQSRWDCLAQAGRPCKHSKQSGGNRPARQSYRPSFKPASLLIIRGYSCRGKR